MAGIIVLALSLLPNMDALLTKSGSLRRGSGSRVASLSLIDDPQVTDRFRLAANLRITMLCSAFVVFYGSNRAGSSQHRRNSRTQRVLPDLWQHGSAEHPRLPVCVPAPSHAQLKIGPRGQRPDVSQIAPVATGCYATGGDFSWPNSYYCYVGPSAART
jgi:hypothetical protein